MLHIIKQYKNLLSNLLVNKLDNPSLNKALEGVEEPGDKERTLLKKINHPTAQSMGNELKKLTRKYDNITPLKKFTRKEPDTPSGKTEKKQLPKIFKRPDLTPLNTTLKTNRPSIVPLLENDITRLTIIGEEIKNQLKNNPNINFTTDENGIYGEGYLIINSNGEKTDNYTRLIK